MGSRKISVKIDKELHNFLTDNAVKKGESYNDIIWRFLLSKKLSEENKEAIKEAKKNWEQFL